MTKLLLKTTEEHIKDLTDAFKAQSPIDYFGQQSFIIECNIETSTSLVRHEFKLSPNNTINLYTK